MTSDTGHVILKVVGKGAAHAFRFEAGKHCVQRVSPTETRGRRHTSIVSVAVLPIPKYKQDALPESELEIKTQCGHGPGGQHQNKTASAVRMTHKPTGLQVFINGRDQHSNRREALRILTARVNELRRREHDKVYNEARKRQMDGGDRGNKIRTYNFIRGEVVDHRLGVKTGQLKQIMKGRFDILYNKET